MQDAIKLTATGNADSNGGNITTWAQESARLALTNIYQFEGKPISIWRTINVECSRWSKCPGVSSTGIVDSRYSAAAKDIAERRILTAGNRLGKLLSGMF